MKKIAIIILLLTITGTIYSQGKKCQNPIPDQQFQLKYKQVKNQTSDQKRLFIAKQIVGKYCFSSSQVKEMASLFENDYTRLEFAKKAFRNTPDKDNFYDVYDAFIYYSVVFRLHDYVLSLKTLPEDTDTHNEPSNKLNFPNYNYPNYKIYNGDKNCYEVVQDNEFIKIALEIFKIKSDQERYSHATSILNDKCFSTDQLMKLASLLKSENHRLSFAKEAYNVVSDIENYQEIKQVFSTPRVKTQFTIFMGNQSATEDNLCKVSSEKFNQISEAIKIENFNSSKVNTAKHLIQQNDCFSSQQINTLVSMFDYENSRLEIAIYAYNFTKDQSNYYTVVSKAFGFNSSKKKLMDYINSQK
jgi:hypothetical protein